MIRLSCTLLLVAGLLGGCMTPLAPNLSRADQDDLARVSTYLDGLKRFEARFVQTGSFGPGAGLVWLDRPGHLRLDYQGAGGREMVIAGGRVTILDHGNGAVTTMPVSRTPLGLLLTPTIQLSGPVTVDGITHTGEAIRVVVSKTGQAAQGTLTLDFSDHPLALLAVSVTDPYHRVLTMGLSGLDTAPALTPTLFVPPGS